MLAGQTGAAGSSLSDQTGPGQREIAASTPIPVGPLLKVGGDKRHIRLCEWLETVGRLPSMQLRRPAARQRNWGQRGPACAGEEKRRRVFWGPIELRSPLMLCRLCLRVLLLPVCFGNRSKWWVVGKPGARI